MDDAREKWSTGGDISLPRYLLFLSLILFVALTLRLEGLSWGLPYQLYPDEPQHLKSVFRMLESGSPDHENWIYPSLFPMAMLAAGWTTLAGSAASPEQIPHYLFAGRLLSTLSGVLLVALTILWTQKLLRSAWLGLLAGLFLAVMPTMVRENQLAVVDSPGAVLCLAAGYLAFLALERGSERLLRAGAVATGLAGATKYNLGLSALWVGLAALILGRDPREKAKLLALAAFFSILGLFVGSPLLPVRTEEVRSSLEAESKHYAMGHWVQRSDRVTYLRYGQLLAEQLGWIGLGLLVLGLVRIRHARHGLVAVSFPIAFFLFMGSFRVDFARSMLPVMPVQAILVSLGYGALAEWVRGRKLGPLVAFVPAVLVATALGRVAEERSSMHRTEQASLAAMDWIVTSIPSGTRIAAEWFGPPLNQWPSTARYALKIQPLAATGGLRSLMDQGFEYVIESGMYELLVENPASRDPQDTRHMIRREHEVLRERFPLVAEFGHIRIYRLKAAGVP